MNIFFSGVDESQLNDRALISNYFMMLIVGYKAGEAFKAKVAFKANILGRGKTEIQFANNSDGYSNFALEGTDDKTVLAVMDCKCVWADNPVDDAFVQRFEKVEKAIEEEKKKSYQSYNHNGYGGNGYGYGGGGWERNPQWNQGEMYNQKDFEYRDGIWQKKLPQQMGFQFERAWEQDTYSSSPSLKEKKISEMTEAEWKKEQAREYPVNRLQVEKWEIRHARLFLNACIRQKIDWNFTDSISLITREQKDMNGKKEEIDGFLQEFEWALEHYYEQMFTEQSEQDYIPLLLKCEEYLLPYKHMPLVEDILKSLEDEVADKTEDMMYNNGGNVI